MMSNVHSGADAYLSLQVYIEQPLTSVSRGKVRCVALGKEPLRFQWTGPPGQNIVLDVSGSEASELLPGSYLVHVVDGRGFSADAKIDLRACLPDALVVQRYECTPSSVLHSRDGTVRAIGPNLDSWNHFIWSDGTRTTEPVLHDVCSGSYSLTLLGDSNGNIPPLMQLCAAAWVPVKRIQGP